MRLVRWTPANAGGNGLTKSRWFDNDPFFKAFEDLVSWNPSTGVEVDIVESESGYSLTAELPGVDKKDLKVSVENDTLTIEAEKHSDSENNKGGQRYSERRYGKFSRSFSLNGQVDAEKIEADYNNGVLTLNLPKKEEVKPREVTVKVK